MIASNIFVEVVSYLKKLIILVTGYAGIECTRISIAIGVESILMF